MSDARAKKLATLEKEHGHQIYRHSTTRYNKQVTIAGKRVNIILETNSNQNDFLDNRITVKHTPIIRRPGLVLAPESTSVNIPGVGIAEEASTKDKTQVFSSNSSIFHDFDV